MNLSFRTVAVLLTMGVFANVSIGETANSSHWKIVANSPQTRWNPRALSYTELRKLGFYAPTAVPAGYSQTNARVAWVIKDAALPKILARRAVWIRYEAKAAIGSK